MMRSIAAARMVRSCADISQTTVARDTLRIRDACPPIARLVGLIDHLVADFRARIMIQHAILSAAIVLDLSKFSEINYYHHLKCWWKAHKENSEIFDFHRERGLRLLAKTDAEFMLRIETLLAFHLNAEQRRLARAFMAIAALSSAD